MTIRNPGYRSKAEQPKRSAPTPKAEKPKKAGKSKTKGAKGVKGPGPVAVAPTATPKPPGLDTGTYLQHPLLAGLPSLVQQRQALVAEMAPLQSKLQKLDKQDRAVREEMEALLIAAGCDTKETAPTVGPYTVQRTEVDDLLGLDETKLLEAGVPADTLVACRTKVIKAGYSYATVRLTKGQKQETADAADTYDEAQTA